MPHFGGGIKRVSKRQNLIRARVPFVDQVRDAAREDGGFASAGARHHQHGALHMLDGLGLLGIKLKGWGPARYSH